MKSIIITLALIAVAVALVFGIIVPTATETKNFGNTNARTEIKTNIPSQLSTLKTAPSP